MKDLVSEIIKLLKLRKTLGNKKFVPTEDDRMISKTTASRDTEVDKLSKQKKYIIIAITVAILMSILLKVL